MDFTLNRPYPFVSPPKFYLRREYYPLSQSLNRKNGFMTVKTDTNVFDFGPQPKSITDSLSTDKFYQNLKDTSTDQPTKPFVPKFVELDKKVLKFYAYFVEPIYDSLTEIHRIHSVEIYFYLLDETISIIEPTTINSGLIQGKIFIRQKVPYNVDPARFISWRDLAIGQDIEMYSRKYTLFDCDVFTRNFYEKEGFRMKDKEFPPVDAFSYLNFIRSNAIQNERKIAPNDKNKRKEILTYLAVWDDPMGYDYNRVWRKHFAITFYSVDDTFQVKQISNAYDGLTSIFLNRQKLKKGVNNSQWYSEADLGIGKWININGRHMFIYDCDKPTRNLLGISTDPFELEKFPPGHLPERQLEQIEFVEQEKFLKFEAILENCSEYLQYIRSYIVEFEIEPKSITIWEKLQNKKGRLFIGKSSTNLNRETFFVDRKVKIFRWSFILIDQIAK